MNRPIQQPPQFVPTPQAQPQGSVPDPRMDQVMREIRDLREQNAQLRGSLDTALRARSPQQQAQGEPLFKPEVEQALAQKFQQLIQPMQQQFAQATGLMMDQTDQARFELRYRGGQFQEYLGRVEEEQARLKAQGKWAPREEILRQMYFEDTGKKAQTPPPQAQPQSQLPVYDTYTGQWKDPVTGAFVAPPAQVVVPPQGAPQAVPQMAPPAPGQYTTAQQLQQYPPGVQPQIPPGYTPQPQPFPFAQPPASAQSSPNAWTPNLPSAQPPPAAAMGNNGVPPQGLDLNASDAALEAWASRNGDIPL